MSLRHEEVGGGGQREGNIGGGEIDPMTKVVPDYISALGMLGMVNEIVDETNGSSAENREMVRGFLLEALKDPILFYREYLERQYPKEAKRLIEDSDKAKVREIHNLVEIFNSKRDMVREQVNGGNYSTVVEFFNKMSNLVLGEESALLTDKVFEKGPEHKSA